MEYFTGKTVEQAIETALKELNISKEDAEITVIEEGSKGVLGLGGKKAKIGVEVKVDDITRAVKFLEGLFEHLNVPATTEIKEDTENNKIIINVLTTESASLIGYRGEMLDAIQTLAGAVANIGNEDYKRVVVDCENYRDKREETLKTLANRLADKAERIGRPVKLEPMNPFERRIIHSALSERTGIKTESQGVEPNRYVVITPDNIKPYEKRDRKLNNRKGGSKSGFKSDMIKITKKTSGFGTFLGNSFKDENK